MENCVRDGPREIFQRSESHGGENVLELRVFFDKLFQRLLTRPFSGEPSLKSVTTSGQKVHCPRTILATLDQLKVLAHPLRRPRIIAGQFGDVVPVTFVRIYGNHGIVSRTASERAGPRIPDSSALLVSLGIVVLTIVVGVMPDEVVPLQVLILCGQRVKGRD